MTRARIGSMRRLLLCSLAALLASVATAQEPARRIVGYFVSWGIYARNYHVSDIPAASLTHVNYAFANLANGSIALGDPYADIDRFYPGDCWNPGCRRGSFHQLELLKQRFPHLRTLISVGGWTWSGQFSDAVLTPTSRATFAQSIVDFVDQYGFDGADIDWEYPVSGGLASNVTRPQDRQNYTLFLQELRARFTQRGATTGKTYLLTIAGPANSAIIANFELDRIHPLLDWINVMSYDLHGPWGEPYTGMNAPLRADPADPNPEPMRSQFNVEAAIASYRAQGVPAEKLGVGLAFYGRGFAGVSPGSTNGLYRSYSGPSSAGTWEPGVFDHSDLAANYVGRNGYASFWHDASRTPWLMNASNGTFLSYDDPRSLREKCWFVQAEGLGGAMFWELSGDRPRALSAVLEQELLHRAALRAPRRRVSTARPTRVELAVEGGRARAGRPYLLLASSSGNFPGTQLPGLPLLPLQWDALTDTSIALAGSALFPGSLGVLDAQGAARAALDLSIFPALPPALAGTRWTLAAWIFAGPGGPSGEPTNVVELELWP